VGQRVPGALTPLDAEQEQRQQIAAALERIPRQLIVVVDFRGATLSSTDVVRNLNRYVEHTQPWHLAQEEKGRPPPTHTG